jgi:hypothetical protein
VFELLPGDAHGGRVAKRSPKVESRRLGWQAAYP